MVGVTPHCIPMGAAGCLHHETGRWEGEGTGRAQSKFGVQDSMPGQSPLCPRGRHGNRGILPLVSVSGCSQIVRRRAGKGAQELSDIVTGVTPLNKVHLSGRQQIQQDFCRPGCGYYCQGFTISTKKHAGAAFGTMSSNIPG